MSADHPHPPARAAWRPRGRRLVVAVVRRASVALSRRPAHATAAAADPYTAGKELIIRGSNGGGLHYTGIPYPAAGTGQELIINGSNGGSLRYTGIPYPRPAATAPVA